MSRLPLGRWLRAAALALALHGAQAQPAACPPTPSVPSADEMQALARDARDRGFLWRATKGGRTSYLYGTVHVGKPAWAFPGPTVAAALRESDTLALELDLADPTIARGVERSGARPPALPASLRERLERQRAAACVPAAALAPLHPVLQAVTLTVLAGRWDGLDPAYAQELVLAAAARAAAKPVVSLETAASQLDALVPADATAAIVMVDRTLTQLEANRVRPVLARLAAAWERGDLADIEGYERWCECVESDAEREFMKRLNDARNPALAERIDALHRGGKRVFAAVGALHMTGAMALPRLLAERGYVVERVRIH